jgi:hypothetical protein
MLRAGMAVLMFAFAAAASADDCSTPVSLVDLRVAPNFVPRAAPANVAAAVFGAGGNGAMVLGIATGLPFTKKDARQTLYVLRQGRDATQLAVFENDALVVSLPTSAWQGIAATADIDGNGLYEVLLRADGDGVGERAVGLTLVSLAANRVEVIRQFDRALVDRCDVGGAIDAMAISFCPRSDGTMPGFLTVSRRMACTSASAAVALPALVPGDSSHTSVP